MQDRQFNYLKKIVISIFLLSFCVGSSYAIVFIHSNPDCPDDEKIKRSDVEKIMYGDFTSECTLDFMNAMPKDEFIEIPVDDLNLMYENALVYINKRREVIRESINEYFSLNEDDSFLEDKNISLNDQNNKGLIAYFYLIFCYFFTSLANGDDKIDTNDKNYLSDGYNNLMEAYNSLTVMKRRLERLDSRKKRLALISLFKQQTGTISKEVCDENLPIELREKILSHMNLTKNFATVAISLRDLMYIVSWSKSNGWLESYPPQARFKLGIISQSIGFDGNMAAALYDIFTHWRQMYDKDWIRCAPGKIKQPIYRYYNFINIDLSYYKKFFSPYFREVLSINEVAAGSLWKHSYASSNDRQKTGVKERIVWFKFPFEAGYDTSERGCYNPKKKSRYQFEDGIIMDSKSNPYLDKETNRKTKKFMSGSTAQDATWALESDVDQLYADDIEYRKNLEHK